MSEYASLFEPTGYAITIMPLRIYRLCIYKGEWYLNVDTYQNFSIMRNGCFHGLHLFLVMAKKPNINYLSTYLLKLILRIAVAHLCIYKFLFLFFD